MFRNLILIIAVVALAWIVRGFIRRSQAIDKKPASKGQDMVQCAHCKTYLPKNEAISRDSQYFCNHQHLEQWEKRT